MKLAFLLLILVPLIYSVSVEESFKAWMWANNKQYETQKEHERRLGIYQSNLEYIENHNSQNLGFTLAMNKFGDLTLEEFTQLYLLRNKISAYPNPNVLPVPREEEIPDSIDWRSKNVVGPVENEGQCGSCWAFVVAESIASACAIKNGKLVLLSVQQIIDCSASYGNQGCNGGLPDQAFQYVIANKGLDTWASYPYTAMTGDSCKFNPATVGSCTVMGYNDVTSGSEDALQQALLVEPVATAIDASQQSFQFYSSGVYYDPNCSSTQLDHGVLIIGYGATNGTDYWTVQNMWGTGWGMDGYILMSRNKQNNCGIATSASYPLVE